MQVWLKGALLQVHLLLTLFGTVLLPFTLPHQCEVKVAFYSSSPQC